MTVPTNADIRALLENLDSSVADDLETHWLEFKPWNSPREDKKVAIEYAVCFANSEGAEREGPGPGDAGLASEGGSMISCRAGICGHAALIATRGGTSATGVVGPALSGCGRVVNDER